MKFCWNYAPNRRPKFRDIVKILDRMDLNVSKNGSRPSSTQPTFSDQTNDADLVLVSTTGNLNCGDGHENSEGKDYTNY
jgi:hypothetical protein